MAEGFGPVSQTFTSIFPQSFTSIQKEHLTFIKHLGSGGFGMVELHKHIHWGKVAVKQIVYKNVTPELRESVRKEVQKMWHVISSPYVVSVMGMFDVPDGGINIVMEYMECGNLRNFTPLFMVTQETDNPDVWRSDCWPRRIRMICDMILGMNYLHTCTPPIIHRDLKLENLFVGQGFVIKIGDLGLSVSMQSRSAADRACRQGTITHIPPETLKGLTLKATKAWDIYSFGITLFEFIALTPENDKDVPFPHWANDALMELWVATNNVRPNDNLILEDTPELVKTSMKECWDADPARRPSFQELTDRFTKFYEKKYETDIESADTQIMLKRKLHRSESEASNSSDPTGFTVSDGINALHNGTTATPIAGKSKKPVQATPSEEGETVDSNQPGDTTSELNANQQAGSVQPSSATESFTGQSEQAAASELSPEEQEIAPLKSSDFKPSCERERQAQSQPHAQPSSTMLHTYSTTAGIISGSSQQIPRVVPVGANREASSTVEANAGTTTASVPEGSLPDSSISVQTEVNSLNSTNSIPTCSTESSIAQIKGAYGRLQQQQQQKEVHGGGTTRLSETSLRPQQVSGQDEAGCLPGQLENSHVPNQTGNNQQQVEDLRKPFQGMTIQSRSDGEASMSFVDLSKGRTGGMAPAVMASGSDNNLLPPSPFYTQGVPQQEQSTNPEQMATLLSPWPGMVPSKSASNLPAAAAESSATFVRPSRPQLPQSSGDSLTVPREPRPKSTSPNFPRSKIVQSSPKSDTVITVKHIMKIEKFVGKKYRNLGRQLGLKNEEIQAIEIDNHAYGTVEVVHQILTKWKGKKGKRATKSALVAALHKAELSNLCDML